MIDRLIDTFLHRFTNTGNDNNDNPIPLITTGSIVLGAMLRLALIMLITWLIIDEWMFQQYWIFIAIAIMLFVIYPSFRQYSIFNDRIENLAESTMCGSCRHFDNTGQMCTLYDEHISNNSLPCEGQDWELKN